VTTGAPREDREKLEKSAASEIGSITDSLHNLHYDYLWNQAARLMIPIPDPRDTDNWEDSEFGPFGRRPRKKAINELRAAVRAEKKARMDLLVIWLPSVIGIIGALTGLAAVLVGTAR
jgi:hypothetical protein